MPSIFRSSTHRREKPAPLISSPLKGSFSHPVSLNNQDLDKTGSISLAEKQHWRSSTVPVTPQKSHHDKRTTGEFGTLLSPTLSQRHGRREPRPEQSSTSATHQNADLPLLPGPPPAAFLPTHLPLLNDSTSITGSQGRVSTTSSSTNPSYGLLGGVGARVVLGLEHVAETVKLVTPEIASKALEIPMLFSNQSLEVKQVAIRLLIEQYVDALRSRSGQSTSPRYQAFESDLRLSDVRTLAWFLRWTLSRLQRVDETSGEMQRGLMSWTIYEEWRGRERAASYPASAYEHFASLLPSELCHDILTPLLALLSRFAAHAHISGLTPQALASLFGPLIFHVPFSAPAMTAHIAYVRSAYATEHILLAYIRSSGHRDGLGINDLPRRLKAWVAGYPSMIATDAVLAKGQARTAARVIRCERASRTVRAYSKDLIHTAENWVEELPAERSPTWTRLLARDKGGIKPVKPFTAVYRTKLAIVDPALSSATTSNAPRSSLRLPLAQTSTAFGRGAVDLRWDSVTGKEWTAFAEGGFDSVAVKRASGLRVDDEADDWGRRRMAREPSISGKLQFDLNESAKLSWAEPRRTMEWTDFASSSGGFTRTDGSLAATLSFSSPIEQSIEAWPVESAELRKRLIKSQKDAVPFTYDTTPRFGPAAKSQAEGHIGSDEQGRVYVEEAFIDFWADIALGAGWIDTEELTFRESSWAFIEYRAGPTQSDVDVDVASARDTRTIEVYVLFEERVPSEYQQAVANPQQRKTFTSLFSPMKKKQAAEMTDPARISRFGYGRNEFDDMLRRPSHTRKITATKHPEGADIWHRSAGEYTPGSPTRKERPAADRRKTDDSNSKEREGRRDEHDFLGWAKTQVTDVAEKRKSGQQQVSYGGKELKKAKERQKGEEVDFELVSASGLSSAGESSAGSVAKEKWMGEFSVPVRVEMEGRGLIDTDVLITNGARPMERAEVSPPPTSSTTQCSSPVPPRAHGLPVATAATPTSVARSRTTDSPSEVARHAPKSTTANSNSTAKSAHTHTQQDLGELKPVDMLLTPPGERFRDLPSTPDATETEQNQEEYTFTSYSSHSPSSTMSTPESTFHEPMQQPGIPALERALPAPPSQGRGETSLPIGPAETPPARSYRDTVMSVVNAYNYTDEHDEHGSTAARNEELVPPVPRFDPRAYGLVEPRPERWSVLSSTAASLADGSSMAEGSDHGGYAEEEEGEGKGDVLRPPSGPIFDLTPAREPSPARYKHGEFLNPVIEGEEDDGY